MPELAMTDAQRIAMEDQAAIHAAQQLRARVSPDASYIAQCAREDAREASGRIIKHMWIIFVLLPIVLALLFAFSRS